MRRIARSLYTLCCRAYSAYIAMVLLLIVFMAPFYTYACRRRLVEMSFALLPLSFLVGVGIITGIVTTRHRAPRSLALKLRSKAVFATLIATGTLLLVACQSVILYGGHFTTGWDVRIISDLENSSSYTWYYSCYPNQLVLAGVFKGLAGLGNALGVQNGYACITVVGCICVSACAPMVAYIGRRVGGYAVGYASFLLFCIVAGLSPWILVPYSDAYAMPFTCMALLAYTCCDRPPLKWFAIVLFTAVGYAIKPTALFFTMAVMAVEALSMAVGTCRMGSDGTGAGMRKAASRHTMRSDDSPHRQRGPRAAISSVAAMIVAYALAGAITTAVKLDVTVNPDAAFEASHFLMMGFNKNTLGVWNGDDVEFSHSFPTKEERRKAEIEAWLQRVNDAGPVGICKLLLAKTLTVYGDGMLSWEREAPFYVNSHGAIELVKDAYGIDDAEEGEILLARSPQSESVIQIVWYLTLLGVAFCACNRRPSKQECAAALALVLLSGFLTLFECRGRYLFLYLPHVVVLGTVGWRAFAARLPLDRPAG